MSIEKWILPQSAIPVHAMTEWLKKQQCTLWAIVSPACSIVHQLQISAVKENGPALLRTDGQRQKTCQGIVTCLLTLFVNLTARYYSADSAVVCLSNCFTVRFTVNLTKKLKTKSSYKLSKHSTQFFNLHKDNRNIVISVVYISIELFLYKIYLNVSKFN